MSWNERTLFELTGEEKGAIQTGPFGSQLHSSDYVDQGTPVVMPQDIIDDRISTEKIACVADPMVRKLSKHVLEVGDIVYPRQGDLGKRAFVTSEQEGWLCGTGCIRLRLPNEYLSPRFLFYYLKQPHVVKFIENKAIGATMLNLNTSILESVPVRYPYAKVQNRIADILSAYDDLIENNNRRMALLEEAIHLLYREWFVYLRFPGHERVKVVDGVPEGWERTTIGRVCEVFDGPHATPKPSEDGPVFLGIKNLTDSGQLDLSTVRHISEAEYANWTKRIIPEPGDIVFTYEATLHKYGVIPRGFRGCLGRRTALLRPKKAAADASFLLPMLRSRSWIDYMESQKLHGATVDRISIKKFPSFEMLLPSASTLEVFREVARNSLELRERLQSQNQRLREARDILLPRLMNGSIAV